MAAANPDLRVRSTHSYPNASARVKQLLKRVKKNGFAKAASELAEMFATGMEGLPKNAVRALELHKGAATEGEGYAMSQCAYGIALCDGKGCPNTKENAEKGLRWIKKAVEKGILAAAQAGHPAAQSMVGYLYQNGRGVEKNPELAFDYYRRSAEANYAQGQSRLAYCYRAGHDKDGGVDKDATEAVRWYAIAAFEHEYPGAILGLASMHNGKFPPIAKDFDKQLNLWRWGAERGHPNAMIRIAKAMLKGKVAETSPAEEGAGEEKAKVQQERAAAAGSSTAGSSLPPPPPYTEAMARRAAVILHHCLAAGGVDKREAESGDSPSLLKEIRAAYPGLAGELDGLEDKRNRGRLGKWPDEESHEPMKRQDFGLEEDADDEDDDDAEEGEEDDEEKSADASGTPPLLTDRLVRRHSASAMSSTSAGMKRGTWSKSLTGGHAGSVDGRSRSRRQAKAMTKALAVIQKGGGDSEEDREKDEDMRKLAEQQQQQQQQQRQQPDRVRQEDNDPDGEAVESVDVDDLDLTSRGDGLGPAAAVQPSGPLIFLSYGRDPYMTELVKVVRDFLHQNGYRTWLDMDDIKAGCDWHAAIGDGLFECDFFAAFITKKYLGSKYCKGELYVADSNGKDILPILVGGDVDLSSKENSGVNYVISGLNWTFMRKDQDKTKDALSKLLDGLKRMEAGGETTDVSGAEWEDDDRDGGDPSNDTFAAAGRLRRSTHRSDSTSCAPPGPHQIAPDTGAPLTRIMTSTSAIEARSPGIPPHVLRRRSSSNSSTRSRTASDASAAEMAAGRHAGVGGTGGGGGGGGGAAAAAAAAADAATTAGNGPVFHGNPRTPLAVLDPVPDNTAEVDAFLQRHGLDASLGRVIVGLLGPSLQDLCELQAGDADRFLNYGVRLGAFRRLLRTVRQDSDEDEDEDDDGDGDNDVGAKRLGGPSHDGRRQRRRQEGSNVLRVTFTIPMNFVGAATASRAATTASVGSGVGTATCEVIPSAEAAEEDDDERVGETGRRGAQNGGTAQEAGGDAGRGDGKSNRGPAFPLDSVAGMPVAAAGLGFLGLATLMMIYMRK